jgi:tRNA (guanine-N7-)-methyltransferase
MSDSATRARGARRQLGTGPELRSFKYRRGRVTAGQQRALDDLWPTYGIDDSSAVLEPLGTFGREAPVVLEIGFGMGETTLAMAVADPARDVLAVDVHTPGAGALLAALAHAGLGNVRVLLGDAVPVVRDRLLPASLDEVRVFFPDPWPKSKHTKRRLLSPAFVALLASRLRPGGTLHVATDWTAYAQQVLAVVAAEPLLVNPHDGYAPRPPWRPVTRFERQGLAKGHPVHDIVARRR